MDNSKRPSLVIGLLQVKAEPWKSIYEKGQLTTWIKTCPQDVQIINIYGKKPNRLVRLFDLVHEKLRWSTWLQGPVHAFDDYLNKFLGKKLNPKFNIKKDTYVTNLHVKVFSTHLTLPVVELALFKYFLNSTKADFLYMSNTSSYVNLVNLKKFAQTIPRNKIYGGSMRVFADIEFASGSNRILSRDLVEFLVDNFSFWDFSLVEDVSMGKLLAGKFESPINIETLIFSNTKEIENVNKVELNSVIHFRLKSGNLNSRNDIQLMNYLHERLLNN